MGVESFSLVTLFNMLKMLVSHAFSVWIDFFVSFYTNGVNKKVIHKFFRSTKGSLRRLFYA